MPTTTVTANLQGKSLVGHYGDNSLTWLDLLDETSGLTPNSTTFQTSQESIGVEFANNDFGGASITKSLGRAFFFFDNLDTLIGSGNIITSATLRIPSGILPQDPNLDTILVSGSAWGGDGSNNTLSSDDFYNLDSSISYSSVLPSPWNDSKYNYNTFTLNSNAISDMNTNGYLNCVLINAQYDQAMSTPTVNSTNPPPTATVFYKNPSAPIELVLTYTAPPTQVSTTESIAISPDNLTSGDPVIYSISNPSTSPSYFVLETTKNADGFYDSTSPQNISGSFSLGNGIIDIVNDNYKVGVIVAPGGGELTFTPANNVVSSSLLLRGTGWSGVEYPSCPPENGIGLYVRQAIEGGLFLYILIRLDSRNGSNSYSSVFSPNYSINYYLDYNSSLKKWETGIEDSNGTIKLGDSSNLVSSNWGNSVFEGVEAFSTTCGYPNLPNYCVEVPNVDEPGAPDQKINVSPLYFIEINPNEPVGWWGLFAGFISYWAPIAGAPDDGWVIQYDNYSAFLPGGSIDSLPLGEITLTIEGGSDTLSVNISEGVCSL